MTQEPNAQPGQPAAKQESTKTEEQQEMERVQEEAANERATEGGYQ
jgi:hypothetical protein